MTGLTKAQIIRNKIAEARAAGLEMNDVVAWATVALGMKRGLARTYVVENWDRPTVPVRGGVVTGDVGDLKTVSNASLCREQIAIAKLNNQAPETVVEWCMTNLGQSRSLATRYVNENWPKVTV